ncbi:hypothetical protein [Desulfocicer niacini]
MEVKQKKSSDDSWKTMFKTGEIRFTKAAERKFFFYMTLIMLLAGIFSKII